MKTMVHCRFEHGVIGVLLIVIWVLLTSPQENRSFRSPSAPSNTEPESKTSSTTASDKDSGCVPHIPSPVLSDPSILSHSAVINALDELNCRFPNVLEDDRDGVSVAIVHASAGRIYSFNHGYKRLNESEKIYSGSTSISTQGNSFELIDGDSIFRIASITKMFTVLETLVLSKNSHAKKGRFRLTLDTRVKDLLPQFSLDNAFEDDVNEITLAMLGSHRAGLERDTGLFLVENLYNITYPPRRREILRSSFEVENVRESADEHPIHPSSKLEQVGARREFEWPPQGDRPLFPKRSRQSFLDKLKHSDHVWRVGEMASYSNSGFNVLAYALESFERQRKGESLPFRKLVERDILTPLNMSHSFLGPIPSHLLEYITTPNLYNVVDLDMSEADDGAGGMFSSTNDLSVLLQKVLLSQNPALISAPQRQAWLRPSFPIADGNTAVGIPWEIGTLSEIDDAPTYQVYSKGGALPGHYSQISLIPELEYGIATLVAIGSSQEESDVGASNQTSPSSINSLAHSILAPAILEAYHDVLERRYAGTYVAQQPSQVSGIAEIVFSKGMLVLRKLVGNEVDVLLRLDQLFWMEVGKGDRKYGDGAKLWGTGYDNIFRAAPRAGCSWGAFDPYQTTSGIGLDKIVFEVDESDQQQLIYEPLNLRLTRVRR
ncbi:beta-lactamase/transpeptidase-like protein [Xylona heveae TC161]|uniref:Beta-lactamase/transpeptidase-like protein n=1 Tax=Xylona heveae (strain CBS 132557 / TC161) TaxID=1328760 RepID=A0A161TBU3_XYLHT|nr:beta-lactamase/transpeptidase-like protein [Xylona heveae TC161]KZF23177.1 beta-lactamase/transpeptidase-like protein [Xylona heveae TC161]